MKDDTTAPYSKRSRNLAATGQFCTFLGILKLPREPSNSCEGPNCWSRYSTHWSLSNMAATVQMPFSIALLCITFKFKVLLLMFCKFQLTMNQIFKGSGLELNRWQAINPNNGDLVHWCIHTSPGLLVYVNSSHMANWHIPGGDGFTIMYNISRNYQTGMTPSPIWCLKDNAEFRHHLSQDRQRTTGDTWQCTHLRHTATEWYDRNGNDWQLWFNIKYRYPCSIWLQMCLCCTSHTSILTDTV